MSYIELIDPRTEERWDSFIKRHYLAQIYNDSTWVEIIEASFKHIKSKHLAIIEPETGEIKASLPLYLVKSWITGNRLVSVPFGTICDPLVCSASELKQLFDYALRLKEKYRCKYIEIKTFQADKYFNDNRISIQKNYKHHYLLLNKDFEELAKSFKRTARQSVRKAKECELKVYEAQSEDELKIFYRLYTKMRRRNCIPTQPYQFFYMLWNKLLPGGNLTILLVRKDQQVIGGALLLKFKQRVTLEFLASDENYFALRPNHLLIWEAIKKAQEEGFGIFDFGRTDPNDIGLMRFKKSWGTTVVDLTQVFYPDNISTGLYNRNSMNWKIVYFLCKVLPYSLYCFFSNFCYKHIG